MEPGNHSASAVAYDVVRCRSPLRSPQFRRREDFWKKASDQGCRLMLSSAAGLALLTSPDSSSVSVP